MLNLFELIAGVSNGSKMLTQEAHKDGCLVARGHLDATKVSDANEVDDGRETNEPRNHRCNKSSGTPIKMLMSYEMSKELEIQQKSHPAIARLMGLDVLPAKFSIPDRGVLVQKPEKNYNARAKPCSDQPLHGHTYHKPRRDLNEVHKQPLVADKHSKANTSKYEHFSNGCCNEISNDKRISLVRHKFMEAKRLATNPKLIFSKEFQDALSVLSSNREIFHRFLEEPKSLPSSTVNAPEMASHQSSVKCITVLKPLGEGAENLPSKQCTRQEAKGRENDMLGTVEGFPQKTKIVVLRPSLEKLHDAEVLRESFDVSESNECSSSREMRKGITHCTQESHSSSRRDETSKGYIGDESSLNVTEGECSEEDCGSPSDSEVLTPTSVFSLDNLNQLGSPFSHSSHSRSSYLLESSLIREAKRQISERWVTAKSDGICREESPAKGHVTTLGELLAFPKSNLEDERDDAPGVLSSMPSHRDQDENDGSTSPILIPTSSSPFHIVSEVAETSNFWSGKSTLPIERVSSKHVKSSLKFKEKVSNFFFSKNNKPSCSTKFDVKLQHGCDQHPGKFKNDSLHCGTNQKISDVPTHNYERLLSMNINSVSDEVDEEVIVSLEEYLLAETASGCRKQHISLASEDTPLSFADDASIGCQRGISRSPPIGSVARSISGNSSAHSDNTPLNPSKLHKTNYLKVSIEEHERLHFIESLLSWSGLDRETFVMYPSRWHSVDSPLDPALLDKFFEDKETSMCRVRRSYWRLLFDCVNCALLETSPAGILPIDHLTIPNGNCPTNSVVEGVLHRVEKWFSSDELSMFAREDNSNILVQTFVTKELMGKVWLEMVGSQVAEIGITIQSQISEDLLVEALDDMIR